VTAIPTIEELRALPRADADAEIATLAITFAAASSEGTDESMEEAGEQLQQVVALRDQLRENA
jgi:hypothetical protein